MNTVIDLENGAVVAGLLNAGVQTDGNGSAVDMNNGDLSTNIVINAGALAGDATHKVQESDDGSTNWTDITGSSVTLDGSTGDNTTTTQRLLRTKRYVRSVVSGVAASTAFSVVAIAQKKYTYETDNSGVDRSPSS